MMPTLSNRIAEKCADTVRRLGRSNYPTHGIVSHFGPAFAMGRVLVHVSDAPRAYGNRLLVTMYQRGRVEDCRRSRAIHWRRATAVSTALHAHIRGFWNGADGHDGISVVYAIPVPIGLSVALNNYRDLGPRTFKPDEASRNGYKAFEDWLEAD